MNENDKSDNCDSEKNSISLSTNLEVIYNKLLKT